MFFYAYFNQQLVVNKHVIRTNYDKCFYDNHVITPAVIKKSYDNPHYDNGSSTLVPGKCRCFILNTMERSPLKPPHF